MGKPSDRPSPYAETVEHSPDLDARGAGGAVAEANAVGASLPPPSRQSLHPTGRVIGRYVIVGSLGEGGMGVVQAAYDTQLNRKVALKFLHPERTRGLAGEQARIRLHREAQAMARLRHPNVVAVYDVDTFDGSIFLAMDFIEGTHMRAWLEKKPTLKQRIFALKEAGKGLAAAHAAGVIHRDFKPDNVLVGEDGRVYVGDFGIARSEEEPVESDSIAKILATGNGDLTPKAFETLTRAGAVVGTPGYIAPEALLGGQVSARSDQFSFGVTAYYVLSGTLPFTPFPPRISLLETTRPLKPLPSEIPSWLRNIVQKALAHRPEDRFGSMQELLDAIERGKEGPPFPAIAALGVAVLSVLAYGGVKLHERALLARCAADPADLVGIWDDAVKEDVKRAFAATGVRGAEDAAERAIQKVDEWIPGWQAEKQNTCILHTVSKVQDDEVFMLRSSCIERAREELRATEEVLRKQGKKAVDHAMDLATDLPKVSWCRDLPTLRATRGLPDDPAKRAKAMDVLGNVALARKLYQASDYKGAEATARGAVEAARQLGHGPTLAKALYAEGNPLLRIKATDGAKVEEEALWTAIAAGDDETAGWACSVLAYAHGYALGRTDQGLSYVGLGRAELARMAAQGREELRLSLLDKESTLTKDLNERLKMELDVVAGMRSLYGNSPRTAKLLGNLAAIYSSLGRFPEALTAAHEEEQMACSINGPESNDCALGTYVEGAILANLGRFEESDALLARAMGVGRRNDVPTIVIDTGDTLAWNAAMRLQWQSGGQIMDDVEPWMQRTVRHFELVEHPTYHGAVLLGLGHPLEAKDHCERALRVQEEGGDLAPDKLYDQDSLACIGRALLATGKPADAIPVLERSLGLTTRQDEGAYGEVQLSLAEALRALHKDDERARDLAAKAKERFGKSNFGKFPYYVKKIEEADAFLSGK